jgi:hypothetical protein
MSERKTPLISIITLAAVFVLICGAVAYANYSGSGNNSTDNKMIIIEKVIDNKTNDSKPNIIYSNSSVVNNNITTTIINNGVPSNVSVVAVADSYGNEGVSVQLSDTAIVKAGTAAPVAKLETIKTKLTRESEVDEEETTGLVITDMFLGDSKRPCEYVNITNEGEFTAHLEGMRLEELESGNVFTFSDVSIKPGKTLQVYSADKAAKDTKYYLGLPKSITQNGGIWNNDGDTAFLVCGYDDSVISKKSK